MSYGVCFVGLILVILNIGNTVKGKQCSYKELNLAELEKKNCQQIVNGTSKRWLTVECRYNYFDQCLSTLCKYFASCLDQTPEWGNLCARKFYWFRKSRYFNITTAARGTDVSYLKNIHVKYCAWKLVRRHWVKIRAIKITKHECQSTNTIKEPPCHNLTTWSGSSMDICERFVNGTKDIWYNFGSYVPWCRSFATSCLQSRKLQYRCWREFEFYYKYFKSQADFTVETISYLPGTRIQFNYHCGSSSNFAVNIVRCRNAVDVVDDDDDDDEEPENDLQTELLYAINILDIGQNNSLEDGLKVFEATLAKYKNRTSANITEQEKMEEVFLATNVLEEFVLGFAQYHLNSTTPKLHISSESVDLQVRRIFYQNESDFHLEEPNKQNSVRIPSGNLDNGSVVLGVVYKDLNELFITDQAGAKNTNKTRRRLNTIIMSATIQPKPITLKENVTMVFTNLKAATRKRDCMFWDVLGNSPEGWSGQGCYVKSMDNSQTECSCNHLTHFAVLMQFDAKSGSGNDVLTKTDEKALEILTYLGLTLSLIGITLTIIGYVFLTDIKGPLSQIRVSLVASLGAGQIIFLAGIGATENKGTCVTVAAFVQYFLMAAFCWMLVEGIYLYLFVVKVYNVSNKVKICHGVSWGFPAIIVALSLSIAAGKDGIQSYVSDKYCWMSSANGLIWIFIVFVVLIELLNVLILVRVIKEMTTMQQAKDNQTEQIRLGIRACVVLIPLLGVTWLLGLLSPLHKAFAYIFTILNSTQGFVIFLLHCVRNTEIRARFKRRIHVIFPAINDGSSVKRSSELNDSASGNNPLKVEVQPSSMKSNVSVEKTSL